MSIPHKYLPCHWSIPLLSASHWMQKTSAKMSCLCLTVSVFTVKVKTSEEDFGGKLFSKFLKASKNLQLLLTGSYSTI